MKYYFSKIISGTFDEAIKLVTDGLKSNENLCTKKGY